MVTSSRGSAHVSPLCTSAVTLWLAELTTTGPYGLYNALELIGTCAKAGKHYLDLNGDVGMLAADVVPRWDFAASQTGSVIVPMCGFESAPG